MVTWIKLTEFKLADRVVDEPWLLVLDLVEEATRLQIVAEGRWTVLGGLAGTGPDGLAGLALAADQLLLPGCRPGALLGRFGGSSATIDGTVAAAADGTEATAAASPFAIGSHCLFTVPAAVYGPLFVGFNLRQRPIRVETLRLTVQGAILA